MDALALDAGEFGRRLGLWYRANARVLPWRGTTDPYRIWVSEIMLQQTRVAVVVEYYNEFLRRFPTLVSLALATEPEVIAAWSGLGYYNRARMLHRAAQFIVAERQGRLPTGAAELRTLPGIGEYTAAAIASIAFGESVAVVDGNVERVVLRLTGRANDATAVVRGFVRDVAQGLMPETSGANASAVPAGNAAGEHNQAMMELGATVCLPHGPLCEQCPVYEMCRTRGEHGTPSRARARCEQAACVLDLRKRGPATEVLLERRPADASVMAGMYELPAAPPAAVEKLEPALRLRHAIMNTNYYVQVYSVRRYATASRDNRTRTEAKALRDSITAAGTLEWTRTARLGGLPLTGLTRKILMRLKIMQKMQIGLPE